MLKWTIIFLWKCVVFELSLTTSSAELVNRLDLSSYIDFIIGQRCALSRMVY